MPLECAFDVILPRATSGHFSQSNQKPKMEDRQYNGQMKQEKGTNNDVQYTTPKTAHWATQSPQFQGVNWSVSEG